jgi:hypothetical protein
LKSPKLKRQLRKQKSKHQKKEEKTEEKIIETKQLTMKQNAEAVEPDKPNEGFVEVTVKIKTPDKKQKSQD